MRLLPFAALSLVMAVPIVGRALCVSAAYARLRSGPGMDRKVTWVVGQYMPLKQIDQKGAWFQVQDLDGEKHWVARSVVSTKMQCVAVKTKVANLRLGPGRRFPSAQFGTADKYTPFKQLQREGEWLQVQDEYKETYWVSDAQVWRPVSRMKLKF